MLKPIYFALLLFLSVGFTATAETILVDYQYTGNVTVQGSTYTGDFSIHGSYDSAQVATFQNTTGQFLQNVNIYNLALDAPNGTTYSFLFPANLLYGYAHAFPPYYSAVYDTMYLKPYSQNEPSSLTWYESADRMEKDGFRLDSGRSFHYTSPDLLGFVGGLGNGTYTQGPLSWDTTAGIVTLEANCNDSTFTLTPAPEPTTYLLLGIGLAGVALVRRRQAIPVPIGK